MQQIEYDDTDDDEGGLTTTSGVKSKKASNVTNSSNKVDSSNNGRVDEYDDDTVGEKSTTLDAANVSFDDELEKATKGGDKIDNSFFDDDSDW